MEANLTETMARSPGLCSTQWLLVAGLSCILLAMYACLPELAPLKAGTGPLGRMRPLLELTVLVWWEPFGERGHLANCQWHFNISGCWLSADRSLYQEAQVVIFHHQDLVIHGRRQLLIGLPQHSPAQRWVWMNFESPSNSHGLKDLAGIFSWTMSYRVDLDIFMP